MQMERAELRVLREFSETWLLLRRFQSAAHLRDQRGMPCGQRGLVWLAAKAGAKAGALRFDRRKMERNVLGARRSCCAAWTAIHTGRPHRIEELSLRLGVASDDSRPAGVIQCCRDGIFGLHGHVHDQPRCAMFNSVNIFRRIGASTPSLAIKFYASIRPAYSGGSGRPVVRDAHIVGEALPRFGGAVELRVPDPARYAGQQSIQIKAAVLPELHVSLDNSRGLIEIPGLAKVLVLCISECLDGHADPHDVCANGDVDIA